MSQFILPYKGVSPSVHKNAFVAPSASVIGDVHIDENSNVWYGCVLRGDVNDIRIGKNTNIQDGTVIHVTHGGHSTFVGDCVTVGHNAILHACHVESFGFVGMQACVMDGAVIEGFSMLAAGALLTPGKRIPKGQLWAGSPAKYMRDLTDKEIEYIKWSATHYAKLGQEHKSSAL